jgi:2-amino-4-hydroxy-6-hydroxymethyldihydropteridine diphosphokinase
MSIYAYIGIGANIGERVAQLTKSVELLEGAGVNISRASSLYETSPVGPITAQPDFLNAVLEVRDEDDALALLERCQDVERQMGRRREVAQGPRCIDLDLLLVGHQVIETESLVLPHPGLTQRAFVLAPLLELNRELVDPRDHLPLQRHLERVAQHQLIRRASPPLRLASR